MGCPIVFRGPNGAAARVAAQHSQEYSTWYAHCPGFKVVAPYSAADAKGLLKAAIRDPNPVIFLENEILYGHSFEVPKLDDFVLPIGRARVLREGSDVTIVAFSLMVERALEAAAALAEAGIEAEVIDLRTIRPLDVATIVASVKKTNRLVSVEEGWPQFGLGSELSASHDGARLRLPRCARPPGHRQGRADALCRQPRAPRFAAGRGRRGRGQGGLLPLTQASRETLGNAMPIELRMPALSPTMTEGNLARWLKKEGEHIAAGDVIAEIETDKATMEVEAVDEGTLGKIVVAEGAEGVPVNTVIGLLLEDGEDASALEGFKADAPAKAASPAPAAAKAARREGAAAAVCVGAGRGAGEQACGARRQRRRFRPDLREPAGQADGRRRQASTSQRSRAAGRTAGSSRRISSGRCRRVCRPRPAPGRAPQARRLPRRRLRRPAPAAAVAPPAAAFTELPLSNMRKVIARRLTESKQTIPHFYLIDGLHDRRAARAAQASSTSGAGADYKLSVNDFVIKAAALALRKVPAANVSFGGDKLYQYHDVDVGVAVAIPDGLVTPVIRKADQKGLAAISREMQRPVGARPRSRRHEAQARGVSGRLACRSRTSACMACASSPR